MKTLSHKLGLKPRMRSLLIDPPEGFGVRIADVDLVWLDRGSNSELDYIHAFVVMADDLAKIFKLYASRLALDGRMYISWPKGGQRRTDLTIKSVIAIGYDHGLVESTALSVDVVWSALKFTHPKRGKVYQNSYGILSSDHRRR